LPQVVISYAGPQFPEYSPVASDYPFVPCFKAHVGGELLFKASVQLGFIHTVNTMADLKRLGMTDTTAFDAIGRALLLYGVRRAESLVTDLVASNTKPEVPLQRWD
jgi:hypothetical protein